MTFAFILGATTVLIIIGGFFYILFVAAFGRSEKAALSTREVMRNVAAPINGCKQRIYSDLPELGKKDSEESSAQSA